MNVGVTRSYFVNIETSITLHQLWNRLLSTSFWAVGAFRDDSDVSKGAIAEMNSRCILVYQ